VTDAAGVTYVGEYDSDFDEASESLRQGDVLEILDPAGLVRSGIALGVVVTANCDLEWQKHGGIVTYVPVVPVFSYVRDFFVPSLVEDSYLDIEKKIKTMFRGAERVEVGDRVLELVALGRPAESALGLLENSHGDYRLFADMVNLLVLYRDARLALENARSDEECVSAVQALGASAGKYNVPSHKKFKVHAKLKSRFEKFPGDCLYLGSMSPTHQGGHVALLRLIRQVRQAEIALKATDERRRREAIVARRASRLDTIYCHRLVQQMAGVFTDIGLPKEYEDAREVKLKKHLDEWEGM
jgi:hypothetical protein